MAAAVEGTPRRVRALLSSFLHSSENEEEKRSLEQEESDLESFCRSQPRNKEAFWSRVETFTPFTWFAKPLALSPLFCAQYGWENSEVDILQCVRCKATLDATISTTWDPDMYSKTCEQLKEALVTGHSKLCPWPDNPSPESFLKLPMYSYSQWLEDYRARWRSIVTLVDEIPLIDEQAMEDMDCLSPGHIEGLQNLVDPGSICWTRNELDLEQASKASCVIALCGWQGSAASDSEVNTISCSLCRRELGLWNFFPLTHVPSEQEEAVDKESPSYLDTGQIYDEERSRQRKADQETSFCSGSNVEENTTEYSGNGDQSEPMEESESSDKSEKTSTGDTLTEKEYINQLTDKPLEPFGLKSPLHRSLSNLPGEEATESLCVEVENESLSERLQDLDSELEFMGCAREGNLEREDLGPRAKRRRLQEVEKSTFHVLSEHRTWCPWIVSMTSNDGTTSPAGWRLLLGTLLPSMSPTSTQLIHETPPQDAWKTVRKLLGDCYSPAKQV
ncbi:uncharacterized protein [Porites lutea]|uniref:uncharacterized protein isoform X1 n=1 Tax=Porites lutea TaxID=51062 RepID=UPI003CC6C74C